MAVTVAGRLETPALIEVSGIARSQLDPDILWVINDGGAGAVLHAIDATGARRGEIDVSGARNADWEDLASLRLHDHAHLPVADVGDNERLRQFLTLYVLEEPSPVVGERLVSELDWRIDFVYPDGARNAEAGP